METPNWCDNELTVAGPEADLEAFFQKAQEGNRFGKPCQLSFNPFVPYPKRYEDMDVLARKWDKQNKNKNDWKDRPKDGYNSGGYEWCITHWGTKWDADLRDWRSKKRSLWYNFMTAWSPPEAVVQAMSKQFPKLKFTLKFWECGVGFKGSLIVKGGETIKRQVLQYSPTRNWRGG